MFRSDISKLVVAALILSQVAHSQQDNVKIAIIGGGIGGTSCAYYLNEMFKEEADIHIYEGSKIGGRLATATMGDGKEYETGGSIIHERNKYMSDFVRELGLERRSPPPDARLGLYNGNAFYFVESDYSFMNIIKMLWRYGFDTIRMQNFVEKMLDKFDRIYDLQKEGHTFENVHDLLAAMDPTFPNYLNVTVHDAFVNDEGLSESIVNELVQASLRCNYGQTINVHEFVGSVSMAGMSGKLWNVDGGNRRVPERLLEESKAKRIQDYVISVVNNQTKYTLSTTTASDTYDYVVVATPLSQNQRVPLQFNNFPVPIAGLGEYHRTVSTLVVGTLKKSKFPEFSDGSSAIILNTDDDDFFNSIGNIQAIDGEMGHNVWKVFSKKPLTDNEIEELFENHAEVKVVDWLAYPRYVLPYEARSFTLAPRLYHINAIEWAASAMEMSCIGAKNVALLIRQNSGKIEVPPATKGAHMEL
ncbi:hypothetical protein HA402_010848 [Bradysia odoriphaga]|nr:hypothetical protein HA402_010848 [Bradysia odoriphaga]